MTSAGKTIQRAAAWVRASLDDRKYREIASKYDLRGFKRIYFVHIRKTGGTSLNNMFLSLSGEESSKLYSELIDAPGHRLIRNDLIYVGWHVKHINRGNYFYAFSHVPLHELDLPEETFTVSCFRDPLKRVVSHYNMLMDFRVNEIDHPCMATEGAWLGDSFEDFLRRMPREHLLNQLYMFSADFDIDAGVAAAKQLSYCFFSDTFSEGIESLNQKIGLSLEAVHIRKASYHVPITDDDRAMLRDMLRPEYEFLDRVRS